MGVLQVDHATWMSEDLQIFDNEARKFFERECVPHSEKWIKQQHVDRATWKKAGEAGLLCASTPEAYGGAGGTFAHEAVIIDHLGKLGIDGWGITLHNAIVAPYIIHCGTEEQRRRWLPRLASGELVAAIAARLQENLSSPRSATGLEVQVDDREGQDGLSTSESAVQADDEDRRE